MTRANCKRLTPQEEREGNLAKGKGKDTVDLVRRISVELIDPDPDQPRRYFNQASLAKLAGDIRSKGQLQIVRLRPHPEIRGRFMLFDGERRFKACILAGLTTVKAVVITEEMTPTQRRLAQLSMNHYGESHTPMECAREIGKLRDDGVAWAEIADAFGGKSVPWCVLQHKLLLVHPKIQECVEPEVPRERWVPVSAAVTLSMVTDKNRQLELLKEARRGGAVSIKRVQALVARELKGTGSKVRVPGMDRTPSTIISEVRALLHRTAHTGAVIAERFTPEVARACKQAHRRTFRQNIGLAIRNLVRIKASLDSVK